MVQRIVKGKDKEKGGRIGRREEKGWCDKKGSCLGENERVG